MVRTSCQDPVWGGDVGRRVPFTPTGRGGEERAVRRWDWVRVGVTHPPTDDILPATPPPGLRGEVHRGRDGGRGSWMSRTPRVRPSPRRLGPLDDGRGEVRVGGGPGGRRQRCLWRQRSRCLRHRPPTTSSSSHLEGLPVTPPPPRRPSSLLRPPPTVLEVPRGWVPSVGDRLRLKTSTDPLRRREDEEGTRPGNGFYPCVSGLRLGTGPPVSVLHPWVSGTETASTSVDGSG